ncbi:MAG: hypothetical protein ABSB74_16040 [Tepidisphaeraceae bacterium]
MQPRRREEREDSAKKSANEFLRGCLRVFAVAFVLMLASTAPARSTARALLATRLPSATLTNVPFVDAIDFLRTVAGVNITVDWKTLAAINISKDAQINLQLHDVTAGKVLSLILAQAGPGDLLTYNIDENVVEVTTRAVSDQQLITVVYYVVDLLQPNDIFNYQITNLSGGSAQVTGTGGGGGGQTLSASNSTQTKTVDQKAQDLIKLIETVVRPEVWRDNGGMASIEYLNGNLIVTAPRSVQEAIGGPVDR